jgi:hypothetical protein
MRHFAHFTKLTSTGDDRMQRSNRLEAVLGILFVLSLIMGTTLWDEMVFAGEPTTAGSWIGLAFSVGACALLLAVSRQKWPLLLCALLFASIRIPNIWLGSQFPESLRLLIDCFAVSISLFAIILKTEIAEVISQPRAS